MSIGPLLVAFAICFELARKIAIFYGMKQVVFEQTFFYHSKIQLPIP